MTMRIRNIAAALTCAVALGGLAGCNDPEPAAPEAADPATTVVSVKFRDSSVPPKYHRSWSLTLDQDQIHVVVDSYGEILADESADMPADEWESFVTALPDEVDGLGEPESVDDGCSGGTGMEFTVTDGGDADTSLELDNCAKHNKEITEDIVELVEPFTDLVHLDKHLSSD